MEEDNITRIGKIKRWLKKPENLMISLIFIGLILYRFYYFILTRNQPVWWDESEYLAAAKNYAGIVKYELGSQRLPGFPLLISIFYTFGIKDEIILKFFVSFIPSLIAIFLLYICIKELYEDRRIAIISTLIFGVLWEHVFYSNRFHTENLSLIFEFLAIYFIAKININGKKIWKIGRKMSIIPVVLLSLISFFIRPGNFYFIPAIIGFWIIFMFSGGFKKKRTYLFLISFVILAVLLPTTLEKVIPSQKDRQGLLSYYHPENPIAWNVLDVFRGFYESINSIPNVLYLCFLFGVLFILGETYIFLNKTNRDEKEERILKSNLLNLLIIFVTLYLSIFINRFTSIEYRWFFPLIIPFLTITSKGLISFSDNVGIFIHKKAPLFLIILILGLGLYNQVIHGDTIVRTKLNSYSQVRESAIWMKENSLKEDLIISASYPQQTYYSERKVIPYSLISEENESLFEEFIKKSRPRFLVVSIFERMPSWVYGWLEKNKDWVYPVKAYYLDENKQQLALVIYEFDYSKNESKALKDLIR